MPEGIKQGLKAAGQITLTEWKAKREPHDMLFSVLFRWRDAGQDEWHTFTELDMDVYVLCAWHLELVFTGLLSKVAQ